MATARELARGLCADGQPVTLIYIRAEREAGDLLWHRVRKIAARHPGEVDLQVLDADRAPPDLLGPKGASLLLIMRHGELFCQAAGPLPATELERAVQTALHWPA